MNTLAGFPLVNQLSEPSVDGSDENARNNCVVASIASTLTWYTHQAYNGDELKDAVYGEGYVGPMSAAKFVSYCQSRGVKLYAWGGSQSALVSKLHAEIQAGHPCLVTMPSQWGTAPANPASPNFSTHVGVACGEQSGSIRVMNPWGGFWQDQSDAWWQARLCFGQVWPMEKLMSFVVPSGWNDNGRDTMYAPDGTKIIGAMRLFVGDPANQWDPQDTPMGPEQPTEVVEYGNSSLAHKGVVQFFKISGQVSWDGSFNGGKAWRTWNGQEENALRNALAAASAKAADQAQLAALQQQVATLTSQRDAANATAAQAKSDLQAAQQQLAAEVAKEADYTALVASLKKVLA